MSWKPSGMIRIPFDPEDPAFESPLASAEYWLEAMEKRMENVGDETYKIGICLSSLRNSSNYQTPKHGTFNTFDEFKSWFIQCIRKRMTIIQFEQKLHSTVQTGSFKDYCQAFRKLREENQQLNFHLNEQEMNICFLQNMRNIGLRKLLQQSSPKHFQDLVRLGEEMIKVGMVRDRESSQTSSPIPTAPMGLSTAPNSARSPVPIQSPIPTSFSAPFPEPVPNPEPSHNSDPTPQPVSAPTSVPVSPPSEHCQTSEKDEDSVPPPPSYSPESRDVEPALVYSVQEYESPPLPAPQPASASAHERQEESDVQSSDEDSDVEETPVHEERIIIRPRFDEQRAIEDGWKYRFTLGDTECPLDTSSKDKSLLEESARAWLEMIEKKLSRLEFRSQEEQVSFCLHNLTSFVKKAANLQPPFKSYPRFKHWFSKLFDLTYEKRDIVNDLIETKQGQNIDQYKLKFQNLIAENEFCQYPVSPQLIKEFFIKNLADGVLKTKIQEGKYFGLYEVFSQIDIILGSGELSPPAPPHQPKQIPVRKSSEKRSQPKRIRDNYTTSKQIRTENFEPHAPVTPALLESQMQHPSPRERPARPLEERIMMTMPPPRALTRPRDDNEELFKERLDAKRVRFGPASEHHYGH
ncbi:hypothetical protein OY671_005342 [Metschnikowia pulcherrima]|nr:hypothetical protein OY671_005342 [Metschnikowia pulcherrima]